MRRIVFAIVSLLACKKNVDVEVTRDEAKPPASASVASANPPEKPVDLPFADATHIARACGDGPIAVDADAIYWAETDKACTGRVMRVAKDGGAPTEIAKTTSSGDSANQTDVGDALAIHRDLVVAGERVVFDDVVVKVDGSPYSETTITLVPKSGGTPTKLPSISTEVALASNGTDAFAAYVTPSTATPKLVVQKLTSPTPTKLAEITFAMPVDGDVKALFARDDELWIVWTAALVPHAARISITTGAVSRLADPCEVATGDGDCALGEKALFCRCGYDRIERVPASGSKSIFVSNAELDGKSPTALLVDGADLWWSTEDDETFVDFHRPLKGGPIVRANRHPIAGAIVDGARLYFRANGVIASVAR